MELGKSNFSIQKHTLFYLVLQIIEKNKIEFYISDSDPDLLKCWSRSHGKTGSRSATLHGFYSKDFIMHLQKKSVITEIMVQEAEKKIV